VQNDDSGRKEALRGMIAAMRLTEILRDSEKEKE
jgi:hypothetical protein